jgi:RNA polymerase sigma-70 factor (ECF subfamily)
MADDHAQAGVLHRFWPLNFGQHQSTITALSPDTSDMPRTRAEISLADFEAEAMPYLNDLLRAASRIVRDSSQAEDIVQDTFLQAWKSFERFAPSTNCRAWLFKILFHTIHHYRRKWFRLRTLSENEEYLETNLTYTPAVADRLSDREILEAIDAVPQDFRAVVLLVDVDEFSYREAAEILGIPIGTVMSRLSRGRRLLRERLQSAAESYGIVRPTSKGQPA